MRNLDEHRIRVKEYSADAPLPNLFTMWDGTLQTTLAAKEACCFLNVEDIRLLATILNQKIKGLPFEAGSFRLPFPAVELCFDWKCPE